MIFYLLRSAFGICPGLLTSLVESFPRNTPLRSFSELWDMQGTASVTGLSTATQDERFHLGGNGNPPDPLAGSQILSPNFGSAISTMNRTTSRGVKNWPISPRNVRPRNFSKAMPFTSSLVSERL